MMSSGLLPCTHTTTIILIPFCFRFRPSTLLLLDTHAGWSNQVNGRDRRRRTSCGRPQTRRHNSEDAYTYNWQRNKSNNPSRVKLNADRDLLDLVSVSFPLLSIHQVINISTWTKLTISLFLRGWNIIYHHALGTLKTAVVFGTAKPAARYTSV